MGEMLNITGSTSQPNVMCQECQPKPNAAFNSLPKDVTSNDDDTQVATWNPLHDINAGATDKPVPTFTNLEHSIVPTQNIERDIQVHRCELECKNEGLMYDSETHLISTSNCSQCGCVYSDITCSQYCLGSGYLSISSQNDTNEICKTCRCQCPFQAIINCRKTCSAIHRSPHPVDFYKDCNTCSCSCPEFSSLDCRHQCFSKNMAMVPQAKDVNNCDVCQCECHNSFTYEECTLQCENRKMVSKYRKGYYDVISCPKCHCTCPEYDPDGCYESCQKQNKIQVFGAKNAVGCHMCQCEKENNDSLKFVTIGSAFLLLFSIGLILLLFKK